MKILEDNRKQGEIFVETENLNDLWTLYNVISTKDKVAARTYRRVVLREGSKGDRKPMKLKLDVETVSFHEFSNRLRIKGKIIEGPEDFVSYGTYHTLNIEINQKVSITKDSWLNHEVKRLKQSSKLESNFIMLFIAIETGLATIAIISNFSHNRIATIKKNIPGKRYEQSHRNKALKEFFDDVKKILEENLSNTEINSIIICGPGNTKDHLIKYIKEKSNPSYLGKVKNCHASSGTESAILETLKSKQLAEIKENVKVIQETEKIEEVFATLATAADLIVIGFNEVPAAAERGAIKELFCVDTLIRGASKENKLEIENIITNVENSGGNINILSSEHSTGQQIIDLGSLVGILRYKI